MGSIGWSLCIHFCPSLVCGQAPLWTFSLTISLSCLQRLFTKVEWDSSSQDLPDFLQGLQDPGTYWTHQVSLLLTPLEHSPHNCLLLVLQRCWTSLTSDPLYTLLSPSTHHPSTCPFHLVSPCSSVQSHLKHLPLRPHRCCVYVWEYLYFVYLAGVQGISLSPNFPHL